MFDKIASAKVTPSPKYHVFADDAVSGEKPGAIPRLHRSGAKPSDDVAKTLDFSELAKMDDEPKPHEAEDEVPVPPETKEAGGLVSVAAAMRSVCF